MSQAKPQLLSKGTWVKISGLKARPDLNGRQCSVESYNDETGRYNVKVQKVYPDTGFEVIALKPEALLKPEASSEKKKPAANVPETVDISDSATAAESSTAEKALTEEEAKMAAKKAAVEAAVALARSERAAAEQKLKIDESGLKIKKATAADLFGEGVECVDANKHTIDKDKDYRMQGEYGAKKFIKP